MQEPVPAPPTKQDLEDSASALLESIVRAEVELHELKERCSSLELAISLGREAVGTAESLQAASAAAKSTSGNGSAPKAPETEEIAPARESDPATQPITPPKPLTIRRPVEATEPGAKPAESPVPEPVLEPVAARTGSSGTAEASSPVSENPEPPAAVSTSLEEQAAALRAAMAGKEKAAAEKPAVSQLPNRPEPSDSTKETAPAAPPKRASIDQEPSPFKPKRATPLKSRLAGLDVTAAPSESESYSDRSAELEQLLRSRDED